MVTLDQIRSSNARIVDCLPTSMVAVFAGGTSGIGEATMKEFAKRTSQPRIYFIGRSEQTARHIENELRSLNPAGDYRFIKADLSLLHDVDRVCQEIRSQEPRINLLFLTSGTLITGRGKWRYLILQSSLGLLKCIIYRDEGEDTLFHCLDLLRPHPLNC